MNPSTQTYRCDNCAGLLSPAPGATTVQCDHCGATLEVLGADAPAPAAPATSPLDEELLGHLRAGRKIEAIRTHRMATEADLLASKNYVEALAARHGIAPASGAPSGAAGLIAVAAFVGILLMGVLAYFLADAPP
jgi:LSD1 subclass zinc finger protein